MRTKIILFVISSILLVLTIFNLDLVPLRREISDMEIVMVAGLDKTKNGYEISFLKREEQSVTSGGGSGETSNDTQVISIETSNFNSAMNHLQTMTDKYITISHIKYYIIGEESAKEDLAHIVDTIARGNQIRLDARVYIAKGMTANEFIKRASNTDYKVEDKLYNMEDSFITERVSTEANIINMCHITMDEYGEGLSSSLEFGSTEDNEKDSEIELSDEPAKKNKKEIPFGFGGAAIFKNMKLIGYLSTDETAVANYIRYNNNVNILKIDDNNDFISFGVEQIYVDVDFKYNDKKIINEIVLNATFRANYEEVKASTPVFSEKNIKKYEKKLNEKIESDLNKIVKKEIEMNTDFLNLKKKLEMKHPFLYKINKEKFMDSLGKCKITVISSGKIQTTYDIVETNIYQERKSK